ncbi:Mn-containing catalase [Actinopolyspora mzabensis]|uniref:Mn-containing catalase n=1 Tax=Actinopolyspora mzabensis TaxID=995066 RepID=A0A1G9A0E1_ACTMZ|nr:manganese catalase family protein [Actinopolyspora mzabensis]SDK20677.1 Mn-containing catalase [Actinopolyspora mzabensis]
MFRHTQRMQFEAKPEQPDALYAKKLQELIGGAWGEMTVTMQYLFQGWNCRAPGKYKDMILDIGTEEMGHVEMLATMVARLLEGAPAETTAGMVDQDPVLAAVVGGMDPEHAIVGGGGPLPADSVGTPWNGKYIVSSGNLLADFRVNVAAESQGRLQTARLYNMTDDPGIKEMLKFNLARDTMHQLQWLAAIEQLQEDGLAGTIAPEALLDEENQQHSQTLWGLSDGTTADQGKWASGTAPDNQHQFHYLDQPEPLGDLASAPPPDPQLYATNTEDRGIAGKAKDKIKDTFKE